MRLSSFTWSKQLLPQFPRRRGPPSIPSPSPRESFRKTGVLWDNCTYGEAEASSSAGLKPKSRCLRNRSRCQCVHCSLSVLGKWGEGLPMNGLWEKESMRDESPCHAVRSPSCVWHPSVFVKFFLSLRAPQSAWQWTVVSLYTAETGMASSGVSRCMQVQLQARLPVPPCRWDLPLQLLQESHLQSHGFLTVPLEQMESSRSAAECGLSSFSFHSESSFHLEFLLANDFLMLLKTLAVVPLWPNKMASFNTSIDVTLHTNYVEPLVYDEMFSEELGGVPNSELQSQKVRWESGPRFCTLSGERLAISMICATAW